MKPRKWVDVAPKNRQTRWNLCDWDAAWRQELRADPNYEAKRALLRTNPRLFVKRAMRGRNLAKLADRSEARRARADRSAPIIVLAGSAQRPREGRHDPALPLDPRRPQRR